METYLLPVGSYYDNDDMLRNKDGVLLPDGVYKDGDDVIMYEGIFNSTMSWDDDEVKKIDESVLDVEELEIC